MSGKRQCIKREERRYASPDVGQRPEITKKMYNLLKTTTDEMKAIKKKTYETREIIKQFSRYILLFEEVSKLKRNIDDNLKFLKHQLLFFVDASNSMDNLKSEFSKLILEINIQEPNAIHYGKHNVYVRNTPADYRQYGDGHKYDEEDRRKNNEMETMRRICHVLGYDGRTSELEFLNQLFQNQGVNISVVLPVLKRHIKFFYALSYKVNSFHNELQDLIGEVNNLSEEPEGLYDSKRDFNISRQPLRGRKKSINVYNITQLKPEPQRNEQRISDITRSKSKPLPTRHIETSTDDEYTVPEKEYECISPKNLSTCKLPSDYNNFEGGETSNYKKHRSKFNVQNIPKETTISYDVSYYEDEQNIDERRNQLKRSQPQHNIQEIANKPKQKQKKRLRRKELRYTHSESSLDSDKEPGYPVLTPILIPKQNESVFSLSSIQHGKKPPYWPECPPVPQRLPKGLRREPLRNDLLTRSYNNGTSTSVKGEPSSSFKNELYQSSYPLRPLLSHAQPRRFTPSRKEVFDSSSFRF